MQTAPIADLVNLVPEDPEHQRLTKGSVAEVRELMMRADPSGLDQVSGSFALVARDGRTVYLARSLDRPLRYFLAKQETGPLLVVAERMDQIKGWLEEAGHGGQFQPTYTRMAPAHHVTRLELLGCPDPNPVCRRFFDPPRGGAPADLDLLGERYVRAVANSLQDWLVAQVAEAPIGVLFSGGVDSGCVLLCLHDLMLRNGQSPARLKAFTLAVGGGGSDCEQAHRFLAGLGLEFLLEEVDVPVAGLDPFEAIAVIEDYKPRDVECATVNLALLRALRERYPSWRLLVDGDGGDENLKDYPVEENPELTIRSVVNNSMLYQEGWGVESIKHSLTYSGGYSRGCVRNFAPLERFGFKGFSPFATPEVIRVAESMPFPELTRGSLAKLYELKGEIVRRGMRAVFDREIPVFPKRRFQEGALSEQHFSRLFGGDEQGYRRHFQSLHRG